jgi:hypothetical protein
VTEGQSVDSTWVGRFAAVTGFVANVLKFGPAFFIAYCVFAFPTYVLPYVGSNSSMVNVAMAGTAEVGALPAFWWHLFFLVALISLTWVRGNVIERDWLVALPTLAAIFDMTPGLNWIPLAPTGFHVATLIVGVKHSPLAQPSTSEKSSQAALALGAIALTLVLALYKTATYENPWERDARVAAASQEVAAITQTEIAAAQVALPSAVNPPAAGLVNSLNCGPNEIVVQTPRSSNDGHPGAIVLRKGCPIVLDLEVLRQEASGSSFETSVIRDQNNPRSVLTLPESEFFTGGKRYWENGRPKWRIFPQNSGFEKAGVETISLIAFEKVPEKQY